MGQITRQELSDSVNTELDSFSKLPKSLKTTKQNKDAEGIYTKIFYRDKKTNVLYATSTLSGGVTPNYTTRTIEFYDGNGNVTQKDVFTLTYDSDGILISEV